MIIKSCPKCGRRPKITECAPIKEERRRMCGCPNFCSVMKPVALENVEFYGIPDMPHMFIYSGEGDDNSIFKVWNDSI